MEIPLHIMYIRQHHYIESLLKRLIFRKKYIKMKIRLNMQIDYMKMYVLLYDSQQRMFYFYINATINQIT